LVFSWRTWIVCNRLQRLRPGAAVIKTPHTKKTFHVMSIQPINPVDTPHANLALVPSRREVRPGSEVRGIVPATGTSLFFFIQAAHFFLAAVISVHIFVICAIAYFRSLLPRLTNTRSYVPPPVRRAHKLPPAQSHCHCRYSPLRPSNSRSLRPKAMLKGFFTRKAPAPTA